MIRSRFFAALNLRTFFLCFVQISEWLLIFYVRNAQIRLSRKFEVRDVDLFLSHGYCDVISKRSKIPSFSLRLKR